MGKFGLQVFRNAGLLGLLSAVSLSSSIALGATLTTDGGSPVGDNQHSKTAGINGPVLLEDFHLIEKLSRFDRERIPERVVHAVGTGAFGVFESYGNQSGLTKASFLNSPGKQTPVFVRFSTVIPSRGAAETGRDPRGFSVKFYTDQGNYDLVMNDMPVFFIRDAIKFPDFIHSFKPSPISNKQEADRQFDFLSKSPEATEMLTFLYSDLGTPASYATVPGRSVHAFKWINAKDEVTYVKYTFTPVAGIHTLTADEANALAGTQPQYLTTELYDRINKGDFPAWEVSVQTLKPKELNKFDFNPLDATKDWPADLVPSVKIGKMTLNKTPHNVFQTTEESAFDPGVMPPGIEPSEDKLLQGRLFSYADAQRYRLGGNYQSIPVNVAKIPVTNNNQDGLMNVGHNASDVNYEPNNEADQPKEDKQYRLHSYNLTGLVSQQKIDKPNDFKQAGELYRTYSEEQRAHLIANLTGDLSRVHSQDVVYTMTSYFYKADKEYGTRLAESLKLEMSKVKTLASKLPNN